MELDGRWRSKGFEAGLFDVPMGYVRELRIKYRREQWTQDKYTRSVQTIEQLVAIKQRLALGKWGRPSKQRLIICEWQGRAVLKELPVSLLLAVTVTEKRRGRPKIENLRLLAQPGMEDESA